MCVKNNTEMYSDKNNTKCVFRLQMTGVVYTRLVRDLFTVLRLVVNCFILSFIENL